MVLLLLLGLCRYVVWCCCCGDEFVGNGIDFTLPILMSCCLTLYFNSLIDFDEKCSQEDHWDVDMSVYYDPGMNHHHQYILH